MTKRTRNDGPKFSAEAYGAPAVAPLIKRQRLLYAYAEEIETANANKLPLRPELATWLTRALRSIACGKDADECLGVKPHKQGVRKDGFLKEVQRNIAIGHVAANTEAGNPQSLKNNAAFEQAAAMGPAQSTIRKNWNKSDAKRNVVFTLADK